MAIDESEAAVEDCNQALIYKPNYVKVYKFIGYVYARVFTHSCLIYDS